MKCQVCQHHPVSFHVTEVTEVDPDLPDPHQQIEQRHLCQDCARQLNLPHLPAVKPQQLDIWKLLQQSARAQQQATQLACPDCGMTLTEFRTKGRLGCPRDYEIFREHLDPLIERIHNAKHHHGRGPGGEVHDGSTAEGAEPDGGLGAEAASPGGALGEALEGLESELLGADLAGGGGTPEGGALEGGALEEGLAGELAEAWEQQSATPEDPLSQLETLERALSEAIRAEEYERAAELRDAIQTLRDGLA
ncbi:MAG: UvrB/UvrC motif-containing protein [Planctomycetota bacterium]|jgi:protein arginine kinase activator